MTDEALRALEREEATTRTAASAAALARALARAGRAADAYAVACRALRRDPASDVRDLLPPTPAFLARGPRGPALRVRRVPLNGLEDLADVGRGHVACTTDRSLVLADVAAASILWRVQERVQLLSATSEHLITDTWRDSEVELQRRELDDGRLARSFGRTTSGDTGTAAVQLDDGTVVWLLLPRGSRAESMLLRVDPRSMQVLAERRCEPGLNPWLAPLPGGEVVLCGYDGLHALGPDLSERWLCTIGAPFRLVGWTDETLTLLAFGGRRLTPERLVRVGAASGSTLDEVRIAPGLVASGVAFHSESVLALAGRTSTNDLNASAVVLIDATTGRVIRRLERPTPPGLLLAGDRVVVWDPAGLELLDPSTGDQVARLDHPIRGRHAGAVAAGGAVVLGCRGDRGGQRSGLLVIDDDPT